MGPLLLTLILAGPNLDSLLDQAEYLFFNRHLARENLPTAYRLLARCRELGPTDERCLYLWSRIHTQMGEDARNRAERLCCFERAKAIAETLKMVNPENPDGPMWWAIAYGRIGQERGVMNSLFMVPTLRKEFSRVLELDPEYATAYDALGVLYYELPPIAGGDLRKSEEFLKEGITIDPNYTLLRLDLARVYIRQRRFSEAREQLKTLLATENPTYPADFLLDDKPEALRLLEEIKEK